MQQRMRLVLPLVVCTAWLILSVSAARAMAPETTPGYYCDLTSKATINPFDCAFYTRTRGYYTLVTINDDQPVVTYLCKQAGTQDYSCTARWFIYGTAYFYKTWSDCENQVRLQDSVDEPATTCQDPVP